MGIQASHAIVEYLLQNFCNTRSTVVTVDVFHFIRSDRTKEKAIHTPLMLHKTERAIVPNVDLTRWWCRDVIASDVFSSSVSHSRTEKIKSM